MKNRIAGGFLMLLTGLSGSVVHAQDNPLNPEGASAESTHWLANFQSTYVGQRKPSFDSPYSGPNSLRSDAERGYTLSGTAYLGWRPVTGTEFYLDPEVVEGIPLSKLTGLAGVPNGEAQKVAGTHPTFYRARLFLRQTVDLEGDSVAVDAGQNQFATHVSRRRLVITAGNFAVNDIFDSNSYAHDPRSQFMNWTVNDYGAWDFAADARGYTRGVAAELYLDDWALRYARALMPAQSNGLLLDSRMADSHGDDVEVEHDHVIGGLPGKLRWLGYRNVADMATYRDALDWGVANGQVPALAPVRRRQAKTGYGVSVEQSVSDSAAVFGRFSADDGEGEEYAWTEADRSALLGVSLNAPWPGRRGDVAGLAVNRNELSASHRAFLSAGGTGFFLGDGRLNYHPEEIVELYYNARLSSHFWLTPDVQHIGNPGYNADRGPVMVYSLRLHTEI